MNGSFLNECRMRTIGQLLPLINSPTNVGYMPLGVKMKHWRGQPDNWKWKPSGRDVAFSWLGLGAVFLFLALSSFLSPSHSSHTGRWRWVHERFFDMFGANGDIVLYSSIGTAFLLFGALKLRAAS